MRHLRNLMIAGAGLVSIIMLASAPASATLILREAYQNAGLSIDACGSTSNSCTVQSDVPADATVLAAFLYGSDIFGDGLKDLTLAGNALPVGSGTVLTPDTNPTNHIIHDVTSIMKPIIEGTGGLQNHAVTEASGMDGETLVVVYQNASTAGQTAIIMDGELALAGDTATLNFANPYVGGDLIMSLGISFSAQPTGQVSLVDVTTDSTINRRLTSCAGGHDDGALSNGALITTGGVGDSTANPDPFCSGNDGPSVDDELYNLGAGNSADANPFISVGDTFLQLNTSNPSFDDSVFFLGITSSFQISDVDGNSIDDTVPEPGALTLFGVGLMGFSLMRRRRKEA
jgi:hypothetical protein